VDEFGNQTTQCIDNHGRLRDGVINIAEQVIELLETIEVVVDGGITLGQTGVLEGRRLCIGILYS
jgi:hypothetical protein